MQTNRTSNHLSTKTIKGTALALKSIHDIQASNSLALGVLSVCDSIADNALKEGLQDTAGLLVDHCGESVVLSGRRR